MSTMNVAAVCNVCDESYNCASRKPLVLPCGHTYCLSCLTAVETSGDKLCPACRESWDCAAYKLPISYMLIPGSNADVKPSKNEEEIDSDICFLHSKSIEYWCCKCQVATCKKCISDQHYAHGNVALEIIFENEIPISDIKLKFQSEIGSKILSGIQASTNICDEGLELIKAMKESELALQKWKQCFQAQEAHVHSCLEAFKSESDSSMKGKIAIFAKLMSQCDARQSDLSRQFKFASSMFATLEAEMEAENQKMAVEKLAFLPQEVPPKVLNYFIGGDSSVQRALVALRNQAFVPESMTLRSTRSSPIMNANELVLKMCEKKCRIHFQLLDSFLYGVSLWTDIGRLEPLKRPGHGKCLASFHGHIRHSSTWTQLGIEKLPKLGLRLESGAALSEVNKILQANFSGLSPEEAKTSTIPAVSSGSQVEFLAKASQSISSLKFRASSASQSTTSSRIGGGSTTQYTPSLFEFDLGPTTLSTSSSLFGGGVTTQVTSSSIFGGGVTTQVTSGSILFGSMFGGGSASKSSPSSGIDGGPTTQSTGVSMFRGGSASKSSPSSGIDGGPITQSTGVSMFGGGSASKSSPSSGIDGGPTTQSTGGFTFGGGSASQFTSSGFGTGNSQSTPMFPNPSSMKFSQPNTGSETWRITDICVSKAVAVDDIQTHVHVIVCGVLRFHIVGLADKEVSWCTQVLKKLIPSGSLGYASKQLWLYECTLTNEGFQKLVSGVENSPQVNCIYLQRESLTEADKQELKDIALQHSSALFFGIPEI